MIRTSDKGLVSSKLLQLSKKKTDTPPLKRKKIYRMANMHTKKILSIIHYQGNANESHTH